MIAQAPSPVPIPIEVEGDKITGEGMVYYQWVLPIDHSSVSTPTTEPAQ